MSVLELDRVTKVFGQGRVAVRAVDNASLTVEDGELVIIMGPSGSGKSTLLQLIGALLSPTSGEIRVNGGSLTELSRSHLARLRLRDIGFVFQSFNLLAALNALDNVALPASMAGVSHHERHARARTLLERLGLTDRLQHLPETLSGGEKQRVAIAHALVNDPPCCSSTNQPPTSTPRPAIRYSTCSKTSPTTTVKPAQSRRHPVLLLPAVPRPLRREPRALHTPIRKESIMTTLSTLTIADHFHDGHMTWNGGGWMWIWGSLVMILIVAAILVGAWLIARGPRHPESRPHDRARDILAERYARGELTTDEYRERLNALD